MMRKNLGKSGQTFNCAFSVALTLNNSTLQLMFTNRLVSSSLSGNCTIDCVKSNQIKKTSVFPTLLLSTVEHSHLVNVSNHELKAVFLVLSYTLVKPHLGC